MEHPVEDKRCNSCELEDATRTKAACRLLEHIASLGIEDRVPLHVRRALSNDSGTEMIGRCQLPVPPKTKVPPKYALQDKLGNVHYWTGRGRTPAWVIDYESAGGTREDLRVA